MIQGLQQNNKDLSGQHLGTMVYEKRDGGPFVAILMFLRNKRKYLHYLDKNWWSYPSNTITS